MDINKDYGYFMISRKLKESWLHPSVDNRKFTKYEAWIWIIENARFVCSNPVLLNGKILTIPRGYFSTTVNHLSKIFGWNERTTEKFLQLLETDGKITRFKVNPKILKSYTLIKVNKYNDYQPEVCDICNSEYKSKCHFNCCNKKHETQKPKKTKENKKTIYGEYKNIKLTDDELKRLNEEYGKDNTDKAIQFLSRYKREKGYKNKDDNLTLRRWVFEACKITKPVGNSLSEDYGGF